MNRALLVRPCALPRRKQKAGEDNGEGGEERDQSILPGQRCLPVSAFAALPLPAGFDRGRAEDSTGVLAAATREGVVRLYDVVTASKSPQRVTVRERKEALRWHSHWATDVVRISGAAARSQTSTAEAGDGESTLSEPSTEGKGEPVSDGDVADVDDVDDGVGDDDDGETMSVANSWTLVSASNDGSCGVWRVPFRERGPTHKRGGSSKLLEPVTLLRGHSDYVKALCTLPDPSASPDSMARRVVSAGLDGAAVVWDLNSEMPVARVLQRTRQRGDEPVGLYAVAAGGSDVVLGGGADSEVSLWDLRESNSFPTLSLTGHRDVVKSVVSFGREPAADSSRLRVISGSADGHLKLWDVRALRGAMCTLSVPALHSRLRRRRASSDQIRATGAAGHTVWWMDVCRSANDELELWSAGRDGIVARTPMSVLLGEVDASILSPMDVVESTQVFFDSSVARTVGGSRAPGVLSVSPPSALTPGHAWLSTEDGIVRALTVDPPSQELTAAVELEPVAPMRRVTVLPDNRHILTDSGFRSQQQGRFQLWDAHHAREVELSSLLDSTDTAGSDSVDFESVASSLRSGLDIPDRRYCFPLPWFSADISLGHLRIILKFPEVFSAEVYAEHAGIGPLDDWVSLGKSADHGPDDASASAEAERLPELAHAFAESDPEWRINLGESMLQGLFRQLQPTEHSGDETRHRSKKPIARFVVPDETAIQVVEAETNFPVHITTAMSASAQIDAESAALSDLFPLWATESVLHGKLPDPPRASVIPFLLVRVNASAHDKPVSLNGMRILRIERIQGHARDKIFDSQDLRQAREEARAAGRSEEFVAALSHSKPPIDIVLMCEKEPLPPDMELGIAKQRYWKRGGELTLVWKWRLKPEPKEVDQKD
jgi:Domain of unknown function (DUF3337)/WD domain, G-beta repeat